MMALDDPHRAAQARLNGIDLTEMEQITDEQQTVNFSGVSEDIDNQVFLEMNGRHPAGASMVRRHE